MRQHPEFQNALHTECLSCGAVWTIGSMVVGNRAIDQEHVRVLASTVYRNAEPQAHRQGVISRAGLECSRRQQRQRINTAAVEWKIAELIGRDQAGNRRIGRFDRGGLARDFYGLIHGADRELQIHHRFASDVKSNPTSNLCLKPIVRAGDPIISQAQRSR